LYRRLKVSIIPFISKCDSAYIKLIYTLMERTYPLLIEIVESTNWLKHLGSDVMNIHWPEHLLGFKRCRSQLCLLTRFILIYLYLLLFKLKRGKVVITQHNVVPHGGFKNTAEYLFLRILLKVADKIIVLNKTSLKALIKLYGEELAEKTTVIPHPLLDAYYGEKIDRDRAREVLNIPRNKFVILYIGTIDDYKDPETLLKAIRKICEIKDAMIILIGRQHRKYLVKLHEMINQTICVKITGYVPDDELKIYLSAADAGLVTYKHVWESAPLNLFISYNLPVIAEYNVVLAGEYSNVTYMFRNVDELKDIVERIKQGKFRMKAIRDSEKEPEKVVRKYISVYLDC